MFEDGMSYGLPLFKMAAQVDGAFFFNEEKKEEQKGEKKGN